jgi:hypothetical protein
MPRGGAREEITPAVLQLLKLYGWRAAHSRPALTSRGWRTALSGDPGFPDVIAVRRERCIAIECKGRDNKPTAEQQAWLDALAAAGIETFVLRPGDLEAFARVLASPRAPAGGER